MKTRHKRALHLEKWEECALKFLPNVKVKVEFVYLLIQYINRLYIYMFVNINF